MALEDLMIVLSEGKHVLVEIDDEGILITPEQGQKLTLHELHYLSAISFMYLGAELKEVIASPQDILDKAHKMYTLFELYDGFKRIQDMTLDEFNKEMRKYNGRS